ncbi:MAG: hypothetical protein AAGJ81_09505 [Verrucomicrobiota bacterium]
MPVSVSYHILCYGTTIVPYARLAARQIKYHSAKIDNTHPRVYIHLDAVGDYGNNSGDDRSLIKWNDWLSQDNRIIVTTGLLNRFEPGLRRKWVFARQGVAYYGPIHQLAVNNVLREFSSDEFVCFVDADCFLTDSNWFHYIESESGAEIYCLTRGLRTIDSSATLNGQTLRSNLTELYAVNPRIHCSIQFQNQTLDDPKAIIRLKSEFPRMRFNDHFYLDSGVLHALKAQALGFKLKNIFAEDMACHIGGAGHMRPEYFRRDSGNLHPPEFWIQRLRLNLNALDFFKSLGWEEMIDHSYDQRIRASYDYVINDSKTKYLFETLPKTWDEKGFELVKSQAG